MAEIVKTISPRKRISEQAFTELVAIYEPHRETAERALDSFEEDRQSWRDYARYAFNNVLTAELDALAVKHINRNVIASDPVAPQPPTHL